MESRIFPNAIGQCHEWLVFAVQETTIPIQNIDAYNILCCRGTVNVCVGSRREYVPHKAVFYHVLLMSHDGITFSIRPWNRHCS